MVNWIDELEDYGDEDGETFECASCGSALTLDKGALCPICGHPVEDAPDAQAVAHLEAVEAERDYGGA